MNQILSINNLEYKNTNNSNIKNTNKMNYIKIITFIVFIFILCTIISYNIYATTNTSSFEPISLLLYNSNLQNDISSTSFQSDLENNVVVNDIYTNNTISINASTNENNNENSSVYTIATLNIPSLNIKYPVLSETSESLLKVSLNKYWGGNPNEVGNFCIVGHNYKNNKFFGGLRNIKKGAIVELTDLNKNTLKYKVYDTFIADPYDTSCTSQLTDGHTDVTLITCYNSGKQRFVVKARAY